MVGAGSHLHGSLGSGSVREEGEERAILRGEVFTGYALNVGRRRAFNRSEVTFGKVEIVRGQPTAAEVLRLSLHGLARRQRSGNELFYRFAKFPGRDRRGFDFFKFREHGLARGGEFVR